MLILRRSFCFSLVAGLLWVTAHRLPAPITEIPEKATPAPEQSAKPKVKHSSKPTTTSESSEGSTKRQAPSPPPRSQPTPNQNAFDGTWNGILSNLPFVGNVEFTLFVSASGTAVTENSANFGTHNFPVNNDGATMKWETGSTWTLTPNTDGKTALVTCNNGGFLGVGAFSLSTVFRRLSSSVPSTGTNTTVTSTTAAKPSAPQATIPTAKPVPNRPGFVYNPFNPKDTRLLDCRGKTPGTKVKDPISGNFFIVP